MHIYTSHHFISTELLRHVQPSKGQPQAVQLIDKICARCTMNFTSDTHFVDLAVKIYQSYYLMMTLQGPKHVEKQCR